MWRALCVLVVVSGCGGAAYESKLSAFTATFPRSSYVVSSDEFTTVDGYRITAVEASPVPAGDPEWFVLAIAAPDGSAEPAPTGSDIDGMLAQITKPLANAGCTRSNQQPVRESGMVGVEQRWKCASRRLVGIKVISSATRLFVLGFSRGWGANGRSYAQLAMAPVNGGHTTAKVRSESSTSVASIAAWLDRLGSMATKSPSE